MTQEKENTNKWKKGSPSPNPGGRPKGSGKPISRLRSTLNKLKELEPDAIDVIGLSVKGKEVDKERLSTSKWVISSISSLTRAALAEEAYRMEATLVQEAKEKEAREEKKEGTNDSVVIDAAKRFSSRVAEYNATEEE